MISILSPLGLSKIPRSMAAIGLVMIAPMAQAAVVIADNFESGAVSTDWDSPGTTTTQAGGAGSSSFSAALPAGSGSLGETFTNTVPGGAGDFVIDYYFKLQPDAVNRQFSLIVSTNSSTPNVNSAAVNLRYQAGAWAAFSSASSGFVTVAGLPAVTAGSWYHMQFEGTAWGTAAGTFSLRVSDAGGSAFTSTASGLTFSQTAAGPGMTVNKAQSFVFNTAFGSNPGFSLDNISATAVVPVPEPAAASLLLLGSAGLLRRRRH